MKLDRNIIIALVIIGIVTIFALFLPWQCSAQEKPDSIAAAQSQGSLIIKKPEQFAITWRH